MAVTQPGAYAVNWKKMFIDTAAQTMEAETHKEALIADTETPNFDTDDFRDDITEVSGTNYTSGGVTVTGYSNVTLTGVMAGIFFFNVGSAATDMLLLLQDFVTAVGPSAADLTIQHAGAGVATLDHTV